MEEQAIDSPLLLLPPDMINIIRDNLSEIDRFSLDITNSVLYAFRPEEVRGIHPLILTVLFDPEEIIISLFWQGVHPKHLNGQIDKESIGSLNRDYEIKKHDFLTKVSGYMKYLDDEKLRFVLYQRNRGRAQSFVTISSVSYQDQFEMFTDKNQVTPNMIRILYEDKKWYLIDQIFNGYNQDYIVKCIFNPNNNTFYDKSKFINCMINMLLVIQEEGITTLDNLRTFAYIASFYAVFALYHKSGHLVAHLLGMGRFDTVLWLDAVLQKYIQDNISLATLMEFTQFAQYSSSFSSTLSKECGIYCALSYKMLLVFIDKSKCSITMRSTSIFIQDRASVFFDCLFQFRNWRNILAAFDPERKRFKCDSLETYYYPSASVNHFIFWYLHYYEAKLSQPDVWYVNTFVRTYMHNAPDLIDDTLVYKISITTASEVKPSPEYKHPVAKIFGAYGNVITEWFFDTQSYNMLDIAAQFQSHLYHRKYSSIVIEYFNFSIPSIHYQSMVDLFLQDKIWLYFLFGIIIDKNCKLTLSQLRTLIRLIAYHIKCANANPNIFADFFKHYDGSVIRHSTFHSVSQLQTAWGPEILKLIRTATTTADSLETLKYLSSPGHGLYSGDFFEDILIYDCAELLEYIHTTLRCPLLPKHYTLMFKYSTYTKGLNWLLKKKKVPLDLGEGYHTTKEYILQHSKKYHEKSIAAKWFQNHWEVAYLSTKRKLEELEKDTIVIDGDNQEETRATKKQRVQE